MFVDTFRAATVRERLQPVLLGAATYNSHMDSVRRELRAAIRVLARKPGVTALAAASLALAIGFRTAAFSVLDAFALRDLPVAAPHRLVRISITGREQRADI